MDNRELLNIAKEAMKNSYAPYSKFSVGVALLCKNGKVYKGCNVENSSYSVTNCAERTALFSAIANGEKEFVKIAIVSSSEDLTFPCGSCRQAMGELMEEGIVVLENLKGEIFEYKVKELLPFAFKL